jgi:carbamate kinase
VSSEERQPTVIAFGGNALIRRDDHATQRLQMERSQQLAEELLPLLRDRRPLVLVHGNGPQVGDELIRVEEAVTKVPPLSLDLCVAATAGTIGVLLERALRSAAAAAGIQIEVLTVLSLVLVDGDDPGLQVYTKPVGPHFTRYRAESLRESLGWRMVETGAQAWRRVVASPRPLALLDLEVLASTLRPGRVVIAAGGGGVPVVRDADGRLRGVEAVVDKDYVAALLARELDARQLLILTDVEQVSLDFNTPTQRGLTRLTVAEARGHLAAGQFPAGSMGPKIESALNFVLAGGGEVLITSPEALSRALAGETGTRIGP